MNPGKISCQKGSITVVLTLIALALITIGIVAGKTLVETGTRFLPHATGPDNNIKYFLPIADSYTDEGHPTLNFGKADYFMMSSRSGEIKDGYLKFNLNEITGPVVKAELRITTSDNDRKNSPTVYLTGNDWQELYINYTNKPAKGVKVQDEKPAVDKRSITVDLTRVVNGNGIYSFILSGGYNAFTKFNSRDSLLNQPTLIVTFANQPPTVTSAVTPQPSLTPIQLPAITLTPEITITETPTATIEPPLIPSFTPSPTTVIGCIDSDDGIAIYQKGVTEGQYENGTNGYFTDSCISNDLCLLSQPSCPNSSYINEGYCGLREDGTKYIVNILKACPNGCNDGACNPISPVPTATPSPEVTLEPTVTIMPVTITPTSVPTTPVTLIPSIPISQAPSSSALKPGDANEDGIVDGLDYTYWIENYGKTVTDGHRSGDFNADGTVDGIDYIIWYENFSLTRTPTPTP